MSEAISARPTKGKDKTMAPTVLPPVSQRVAQQAMRHFICSQLYAAGFASANVPIIDEIERTTIAFLTELYAVARDYANVAYRAEPNAHDMIAAVHMEAGMDISKLSRIAHKKRKHSAPSRVMLRLPSPAPQPPVFLPSDSSEDERAGDSLPSLKIKKAKAIEAEPGGVTGATTSTANTAAKPGTLAVNAKPTKKDAAIPNSLRDLPKHLPSLPPKHTYLSTPPPKVPTRTLASLEARHQTSLLIQESLRALVQGTESPPAEPTGPLQDLNGNSSGNGHNTYKGPPTLEESGMGGVVNYEASERTANGTRRKRWRV